MKALSILQPWAWLIIRPDIITPEARLAETVLGQIKNIENRTWSTPFRGRVMVHAGKKLPKGQYAEYTKDFQELLGILLPAHEEMLTMTGGIIGAVDIVDCVREHKSKWKFEDTWGFVLENAVPCPFIPYKGALGFFDVDGAVVRKAVANG